MLDDREGYAEDYDEQAPYTPRPPRDDRDGNTLEPPKPKLTIKLDSQREIKVIDVELRYIDENGKPLSLQEFVDKLITQLPGLFHSVDDLREIWSDPDKRDTMLKKLKDIGFDKEQLVALRNMFEADECDLFDLLAYLAFEQPMATRKSRADSVPNHSKYFARYENKEARKFLEFILSRYEQTGTEELSRDKLSALIELSGLGTIKDASGVFGGQPAQLLEAFKRLQYELYRVA